MKFRYLSLLAAAAIALTACHEDPNGKDPDNNGTDPDVNPEIYAGGLLGTTFNSSASAFEDPAPAVEKAGLTDRFKYGEYFFERSYTQTAEPFDGLGPLYIRNSCQACHPGYGHGKRMERYRWDDWGNGYLLVVYDKSNDAYLSSLTGMPQTAAVEPFKAPLDEDQITIQWLTYVDEWGNKFPDGETYELIYPEVSIPESAFYVPIQSGGKDIPHSQVGVRLETTIGIYGTGLLDAIPDDSLKAQYAKEEAMGIPINPAFFSGGEWVKQYSNTVQGDGEQHPFRFTYALSRGALQDGPGANAIWNITNVTRSDRRYHYMTAAYATMFRTASMPSWITSRQSIPKPRADGVPVTWRPISTIS